MSDFTASNGLPVIPDGFGGYQFVSDTAFQFGEITGIGSHRAEALREFFRAEEDKRLGRWRWPKNPEYVVYPRQGKTREASVISEAHGCWGQWRETEAIREGGHDTLAAAAVAYFDAHPEPKPSWHDAKHGEIWVLFVAIKDEPYRVNGDVFEPVSNPGRIRIPLMDARIQSGRRIYPEDTE